MGKRDDDECFSVRHEQKKKKQNEVRLKDLFILIFDFTRLDHPRDSRLFLSFRSGQRFLVFLEQIMMLAIARARVLAQGDQEVPQITLESRRIAVRFRAPSDKLLDNQPGTTVQEEDRNPKSVMPLVLSTIGDII